MTRPQNQAVVHSVYIGRPKTLRDAAGEYRSSIDRDQVTGPVELEIRGFKGDKATQAYHGTLDQAVCCHFLEHYNFWQEQYGLDLGPGDVGENLTLASIHEADVCIGDIYQLGTARVQISAPRSPCSTQARHVRRADWVKLTLKELRTGIYMRVLEPGTLQAGDAFALVERPNPEGTILAFNRCYYQAFDQQTAAMFAEMGALNEEWREEFNKKLKNS